MDDESTFCEVCVGGVGGCICEFGGIGGNQLVVNINEREGGVSRGRKQGINNGVGDCWDKIPTKRGLSEGYVNGGRVRSENGDNEFVGEVRGKNE